MAEHDKIIHDLRALRDFGRVNEIKSIEDVAENAITEIKKLRADVQRLQRDFNELDAENLEMLQDMELLAATNKPCMICSNMNCEYRDTKAQMGCDNIMWREVCEKNTEDGGMNYV